MNRRLAATLLAGSCLLAPLAQAQTQAAWKPTERINFVIGVAPGGTVDLYARGIKDTLDTLKLVNGQTILVENKVGAGGALAMQLLKSQSGNAAYLGPCPPQGAGPHHYTITLIALDLAPTLPGGLTREAFLEKVKGHMLSSATLGGLFARTYSDH